jgi:large subunit ribosomal protein L3
MSIGLLGKKVGMTRVFTENGQSIPVTVLKIETNVVSMIKNIESDGYNALQMSSVELKENKVKKPHLGHFKKNNIAPQKNIKEFRVEDTADIEVGQKFEATHFEEGTFVNVRSRSKGKGFAGTIKRHNFKGKDATHGNSISHRTPGSTGQCQFPGRVFKGKKMAGQMGDEMITRKNLQIVKIDAERKLILVKGAVPGFNGRLVEVTQSAKRKKGNS